MIGFAGFAGAGVCVCVCGGEGRGWGLWVKLLALAHNPEPRQQFNISLRCVKNIKLVPNMGCLKVFQIISSACAELVAFAFTKSGLEGFLIP